MTPKDRKKLVALLGMTGSSEDGEVANAGRMANQMVRELGLTWDDVVSHEAVESVNPTPEYRTAKRDDDDLSHRVMAEWLLEQKSTMLSTKERLFCEDMLEWNYPTDKQLQWLTKIYRSKGGA